jgi:8-oxo-dGTP pyrophosphatase MutT (NUDIX family)
LDSIQAEAAVLVLLGGRGYVLLERKNCDVESYWACDIALPGGHIEPGEDEADAALREAWEEAWVNPGSVKIIYKGPFHATRQGSVIVRPIVALAEGPICAMPRSPEVDMVFWSRLEEIAGSKPRRLRHPRGFEVTGVDLGDNMIVWGLTLRILTWVYSALEVILSSPGASRIAGEGSHNSGG